MSSGGIAPQEEGGGVEETTGSAYCAEVQATFVWRDF